METGDRSVSTSVSGLGIVVEAGEGSGQFACLNDSGFLFLLGLMDALTWFVGMWLDSFIEEVS